MSALCAENHCQVDATIAAEAYPILGYSNDLHRENGLTQISLLQEYRESG